MTTITTIIKKGESEFEEKFIQFYDMEDEEYHFKHLKQFFASSQLALLEAQKKVYEGMMKRPDCPCKDWDTSPCSVHSISKSTDWIRIGNNSALSQVIQSLEESITYLKK